MRCCEVPVNITFYPECGQYCPYLVFVEETDQAAADILMGLGNITREIRMQKCTEICAIVQLEIVLDGRYFSS